MKFKPFWTTLLALGLMGILSGFSVRGLSGNPLKALVIRLTPGLSIHGADPNLLVEAFEVSSPLGGREAQVQTVHLPIKMQPALKAALAQKSSANLKNLVKTLGSWSFLVGMTGDGDGWPWYFGGGWKTLFQEPVETFFDDLSFWDRFYLCWMWPVPPPAPYASAIPVENTATVPAAQETPSTKTPLAIPESKTTPMTFNGEVRLEILNGCGITNAADWVARKVKGPGLTITGTGNADNFHYSHTVLQTAVGVPVAMEELLERLGLTKDSVQEVPNLAPPNDAVLIVGKDFRKLKERRRDRLHH